MSARDGEHRLGSADPVTIVELSITSWCNYRCAYCVTTVQPRRADARHAFDHHPPDAWAAALGRVPAEVSLVCRGGEPFLDHDGFAAFLVALGALPRLRYVRVDTNGSWSPARYDGVPAEVRRRTQLNVSFHPTQLGLDAFTRQLGRIVDAGWQVAMVNYVMAAGQAGDFERVRAHLGARLGVHVNPNPDAFDPAWTSAPPIRRAGQAELRRRLPVIDVERKTGAPTAGKPCAFPAIGWFVAPDGVAERACGHVVAGEPRRLDLLRDAERMRPLAAAVACPQPSCVCLDRYAFLDELPTRGRALDLLGEYVRDATG